jgi:hypothetical protein
MRPLLALLLLAASACGQKASPVLPMQPAKPTVSMLPDASITHRLGNGDYVQRGVIIDGETGLWLGLPGEGVVIDLAPVPTVPSDAKCGRPDADAGLWLFPGRRAFALELDTEATYWTYLPSRKCMVHWPAFERPSGDEIQSVEVSWDYTPEDEDSDPVVDDEAPSETVAIDLDGDGRDEKVVLDLAGLHVFGTTPEDPTTEIDLGVLPDDGFDPTSWNIGTLRVAFERGPSVLMRLSIEARSSGSISDSSLIAEGVARPGPEQELETLFREQTAPYKDREDCGDTSGYETGLLEIALPTTHGTVTGSSSWTRSTSHVTDDPACRATLGLEVPDCTGDEDIYDASWSWTIEGEEQYVELANGETSNGQELTCAETSEQAE